MIQKCSHAGKATDYTKRVHCEQRQLQKQVINDGTWSSQAHSALTQQQLRV